MNISHHRPHRLVAGSLPQRQVSEFDNPAPGAPNPFPDASQIVPAGKSAGGYRDGQRNGAALSNVTLFHPHRDGKHAGPGSPRGRPADRADVLQADQAVRVLQGEILNEVAGYLAPADILNMAQTCRVWADTLAKEPRGAPVARITFDGDDPDLRERAQAGAQRYVEAIAATRSRSPRAIALLIRNAPAAERVLADLALEKSALLGAMREDEDYTRTKQSCINQIKVLEGLVFAIALALDDVALGKDMPADAWATAAWLAPSLASVMTLAGSFANCKPGTNKIVLAAMVMGGALALAKGIVATRLAALDTAPASVILHHFATTVMIIAALTDCIACSAAARRQSGFIRSSAQRRERVAAIDAETQRARATFSEAGLNYHLTGIDRNVIRVRVEEEFEAPPLPGFVIDVHVLDVPDILAFPHIPHDDPDISDDPDSPDDWA